MYQCYIFKWVTFQPLLKSVQYWRKDQQLLLGYYCQVVLEKGLLSDIRTKFRHHKWTLQQDGAPEHNAHNTIDYLRKENVDFTKPDNWHVAPKQPWS